METKARFFVVVSITHVIYIKKVFEIPTRYHTFPTYLFKQQTCLKNNITLTCEDIKKDNLKAVFSLFIG